MRPTRSTERPWERPALRRADRPRQPRSLSLSPLRTGWGSRGLSATRRRAARQRFRIGRCRWREAAGVARPAPGAQGAPETRGAGRMSQGSDGFQKSALALPAMPAPGVQVDDDVPVGEGAFWVRHLLLLACGVALMLSAVRAVRGIREEASIALNHVSGAWATLALDFARGEVYRPLISDGGYGGTRYFPLHFVLPGLLIKLGLSPLVAGHALSIAALIALLCGAYALLRCLRVPAAFAGPGAILLLANPPIQGALITIRGDVLACAFNVCGLAFALSDERARRRWL